MLNWVNTSTDKMPDIMEDVICMSETGQIEFGFRSEIDDHPIKWIDFSFPVVYWAYVNYPDEYYID